MPENSQHKFLSIVSAAFSKQKYAAFSKQKFLSIASAAFFVLSVFLMNAFVIVEAGTVGVVTHFGAVQSGVLDEGLHFVTPFRTKVVPVDVRVQKIEAKASAASKDLQVVTSKVALNFVADKDKADEIYQKLGLIYRKTIIAPRIQESVKSITSQYTAEELVTRRAEVKTTIFEDIKKRLASANLIATDFSIIDFSFSPEFNRAIEEKQVAEQAALRAKNDLIRIKTEAEQVRAKARGEAEAKLEIAKAEAKAQKLLRETIDDNIIDLRAIERWDGILPLSLAKKANSAIFDVVGTQKVGPKKLEGDH